MRPISARFRDALGVAHRRATEITCTVPGGDPVPIGPSEKLADGTRTPGWSAGTVSTSKSTGVRYSANLTVVSAQGSDTYEMISTPGAIFKIRHGIDFGAGDRELVDCGEYEAAKAAKDVAEGVIALPLVDLWQRVEANKFLSPHYPESGTRASRIAEAVQDAIPWAPMVILADGGLYEQGDNLWDRDRPKFIADMANDGSLDAAFDASGAFRIRSQPILDPKASVWTFRTGAASNINSATRDRPFDRLYNIVVVEPDDATQAWDRQIVVLGDSDHPRHPSKIGERQVFYRSATLETADQAAAAGQTIMQRVLGTTETISIDALGNPALEADDVVTVAHDRTATDPGFAAIHMIDSLQMDLRTGGMTLATRSADLADLELS